MFDRRREPREDEELKRHQAELAERERKMLELVQAEGRIRQQ